MTITLVEELPKKPFFTASGKTLVYFFFDSSSEDRKTATAMLRGLLWQLITQNLQLVRFLLLKYRAQKEKLFTSFDALWNVFLSIANDVASGEKYFIIDALDECQQDSRDPLLKALYDTFQPSNLGKYLPDIRILITSRPYPEIREELQQFNNKDLSSFDMAKRDVEVFIHKKVAELQQKKRYTPKVTAEILQILTEKAEGTFLWVGIACEELSRCTSKDAIKTLQKLPRGLHSLYKVLLDTALDYEQGQGEVGKETIKRILSFVTTS
jgi:NACHT domain